MSFDKYIFSSPLKDRDASSGQVSHPYVEATADWLISL